MEKELVSSDRLNKRKRWNEENQTMENKLNGEKWNYSSIASTAAGAATVGADESCCAQRRRRRRRFSSALVLALQLNR